MSNFGGAASASGAGQIVLDDGKPKADNAPSTNEDTCPMRDRRERADYHSAIDTEVFDNEASTWDELSVAAQLDLALLYIAQLPVTHRTATAMVDIYSDCPRLVAATAMMITGDDLLEDRERARHALLGAVGEYIAAEIKTAVWRRDSSREDRFLAAENLADDLISERRSSV